MKLRSWTRAFGIFAAGECDISEEGPRSHLRAVCYGYVPNGLVRDRMARERHSRTALLFGTIYHLSDPQAT